MKHAVRYREAGIRTSPFNNIEMKHPALKLCSWLLGVPWRDQITPLLEHSSRDLFRLCHCYCREGVVNVDWGNTYLCMLAMPTIVSQGLRMKIALAHCSHSGLKSKGCRVQGAHSFHHIRGKSFSYIPGKRQPVCIVSSSPPSDHHANPTD